MKPREELLKLFQANKELAARNPDIAAQVLAGKTPEALIPARLPQNLPSRDSSPSSKPIPQTLVRLPKRDSSENGAAKRLNGGTKKRKYRNEPVELNGIKFDSRKEAKRYGELRLLERAGQISHLECHPKYEFQYSGVKIGSFKPDFRYMEKGQVVIEDVKSPSTRKETSYRIRKRLLKAFYGLDVREI